MPIEFILSMIEVRVLGSLIEKELTTPEYYPLTLNSLVLACNQKSNRDPAMALTEAEVMQAIESLRSLQLAWQRSVPGARAVKFEHNLTGKWHFSPDEVSVLCVLLLRGPQTVGEIKGRTGRMHEFAALPDVEATLQKLMTREDGPFVCKLPRAIGFKEGRYAHLLSGQPETPAEPAAVPASVSPMPLQTGSDRLSALEARVCEQQDEINLLKSQLADFRKQFE